MGMCESSSVRKEWRNQGPFSNNADRISTLWLDPKSPPQSGLSWSTYPWAALAHLPLFKAGTNTPLSHHSVVATGCGNTSKFGQRNQELLKCKFRPCSSLCFFFLPLPWSSSEEDKNRGILPQVKSLLERCPNSYNARAASFQNKCFSKSGKCVWKTNSL